MEKERQDIILKVKKQDNPNASAYWEEYKIPYKPNINIIAALMRIRNNPINTRGENVTAPVWECNCLEEVCGACTMVINGNTRQACSTLIDRLPEGVITLEPLSKFPVVRDLIIDRKQIFENLKRVKV